MPLFPLRYWKYLAVLLVLAGLALWIQHAVVGYGNERVRLALAPWQAAQTAWHEKAKANDKTNRDHNAEVLKGHEQDLARIARERDGIGRLLEQTRDRGRRVEEAYRLALSHERGRVAAGSATVARLLEDIGRARRAADSSLAAYDAACRKDALTLTSLQDEVRPWVVLVR